MGLSSKTRAELIAELENLRARIAELEQSEKKYRRSMETASDAIILADVDSGIILQANKRAGELLGFPPEQIAGMHQTELHPPDQSERYAALFRRALEEGMDILENQELHVFHRSGRLIPVEISGSIVELDDRRVIHGIFHDLTEHKRLEEELNTHRKSLEELVRLRTTELNISNQRLRNEIADRKFAQKALQESEERYRTLVEHMPDQVLLLDKNARIVYINYVRDFSSPEEVRGKKATEFLQPEYVPVFEESLCTAFREKTHCELDFVTVFGKRYHVRLVPLGEQVMSVTTDITERKRVEELLRRTSSLAAVGELAAGVAHEINNPLATIEIQTGLLHDILQEDCPRIGKAALTRLEKCRRMIDEQVRRCQTITENLQSFARMPAAEPELFDVNPLLERTIELVKPLTEETVNIETALDEHIPPFLGDRTRLQQVFLNILSNAARAAGQDGSIQIRTETDNDGNIIIQFTDSGPGIQPEIQDRIFDPFFTTNPEGTGLGLSISHYIVTHMNGDIRVKSSPGQGSTFTVVLPPATRATA
jgi:PAS domain S-box-containing protein